MLLSFSGQDGWFTPSSRRFESYRKHQLQGGRSETASMRGLQLLRESSSERSRNSRPLVPELPWSSSEADVSGNRVQLVLPEKPAQRLSRRRLDHQDRQEDWSGQIRSTNEAQVVRLYDSTVGGSGRREVLPLKQGYSDIPVVIRRIAQRKSAALTRRRPVVRVHMRRPLRTEISQEARRGLSNQTTVTTGSVLTVLCP